MNSNNKKKSNKQIKPKCENIYLRDLTDEDEDRLFKNDNDKRFEHQYICYEHSGFGDEYIETFRMVPNK